MGLDRVRRQRVQALMRLRAPPSIIVDFWMLGLQVRLVLRFEWLTLCPVPGTLPQISHLANAITPFDGVWFSGII